MGNVRTATVCVLVVLACAATQVSSQNNLPKRWHVDEYPNPQNDYNLCGRQNVSSVCDPDGVISTDSANSIDQLINSVYRDTRCLCHHCRTYGHGYIIKVAIMKRMERVYRDGANTTAGMLRDAQMYSYILTKDWKMEGHCNETLLILYAKNDGILYTLTRQQSKMTLSDKDVKVVSLAVRHYFDRDDTIAAGISEMIQRYRLVFEGKRKEAFQSAAVGPQR